MNNIQTPTWKKWQIIIQIYKCWKEFPELRLGQLIDNTIQQPTALYYMSDDRLSAQLDSYLKCHKPAKRKRLRKIRKSS